MIATLPRNTVLLVVAALLIAGAGLRGYHLSGYLEKYPNLTADAIEYKGYGDYLLGRTEIEPIADRPPGFPLLLGLIYTAVGHRGNSATLQASLGVVFDLVLILLVWWVTQTLCGSWPALVAAFLVALNGELVRCSALSGTEQLYGVVSVLLLACLLRLRDGHHRGWFLLAALLGTWLVVIKQEGGLVLGGFAAFYLWSLWRQQRPGWVPALGRTLALLVLPLAAYGGYKYYSSQVLGIPTMDLRTGNALFHAEFLAGRLPWGYMRDLRTEYFQITNSEWLFQFHTPVEVAQIIGKSTLLVGRILTEMVGGWPWALLVLAGFLVGLRDARLRPLPVLFIAAALPFCLLAEPHSHSSYTPRLLLPAMPFAAMCAAVGAAWGAGRLGGLAEGRQWVVPGAYALLLGYYAAVNLGGETGFGEQPQTFRTAAGGPTLAMEEPPTGDLDVLVAKGMRLQIAGDRTGAAAAFDQVLGRAPEYGPARMGLALLALGDGDPGEAVRLLDKALAMAPYFAEARTLLVAIKLKQREYDEAFDQCKRCVEYRPDYPPCHYLLAHLYLDHRRDYRGAVEHYERFIHLNHQAHLNQLDLLKRNIRKNPGDAEIQEVLQEVERYLATDQRGRTTPAAWFYLNRSKSGAMSGRVKPADREVYFCLGLAYERLGEKERAMQSYERSVLIGEFAAPAGRRLEALRQGGEETWPELGAGLYQADALVRYAVSGYFDQQYGAVHPRDGKR